MTTAATILADSVSAHGVRVITAELTFPRIVLAEFNTHRFSRNSASSRAIPIKRQIERVLEHPFVPTTFPENQAGMQPAGTLDADATTFARAAWLRARDEAVSSARRLADLGVHKQIANRLLEPWMYHTVIATAHLDGPGASWRNFFDLRCDAHAQEQIREVAELLLAAVELSTPVSRTLSWHLPLVSDEERLDYSAAQVIYLSAGRTARVSYDRVHDTEPPEKSIERAKLIAASHHWSPWEHQCQARLLGSTLGNIYGWRQARHLVAQGEIQL